MVQIDTGAKYNGYCADQSRVFFTGKKTSQQERVFCAVQEAKEASEAAVKMGQSTHELDRIARGTLAQYDLEKYFTHSLGHGVGLEIHEGVTLSEKSPKQKLLKNEIIDKKIELLQRLDGKASEALFSPTPGHWLRHPCLSFGYQSLIDREARMIGTRQTAGMIRGWSRRIHMGAAVLFYGGLLAHIIVVLFFAGYAAGDGEIDWWYITAWGR